MHNRYESQPFQIVRQINNFSPKSHGVTGLKERNDFNNMINIVHNGEKGSTDRIDKLSISDKTVMGISKNRISTENFVHR